MTIFHHYQQVNEKVELYDEKDNLIISIHFLAFLKAELSVNQIFDLTSLKRLDRYYYIKEEIIKLLGKKICSTKFILSQFSEEEIVKEVLADLCKYGYFDEIDNLKLCFNKSLYKKHSKKEAILYAKSLLFEEELIKKVFADYDELEILRKVNTYSLKKYSLKQAKLHFYQKYVARGFEIDNINLVLAQFSGSNEEENLLRDYQKIRVKLAKKYQEPQLLKKIIEGLLNKGYNYHDILAIVSEEKYDD